MVLNKESFEDVHEFADISRPIVAGEFAHERCGNDWCCNTEPSGESLNQELNQDRNIFSAISKSWHFDTNYVQPKKEIPSEMPIFHLGLQIAVRRCDDSSRHHAGVVTPNSLVHLIMKNSKQLGLQRETQFADLIQEESSACCGLKSPDARCYCTREGTALVSEELALYQGPGQPRAVQVNKCASPSRGKFVKQASSKALPGAGFTGDENGRAKRRNCAEFSPNPPNGRALTDQSLLGKPGGRTPCARGRSSEYVFGCRGDSNHIPHSGRHDLSCLYDADSGCEDHYWHRPSFADKIARAVDDVFPLKRLIDAKHSLARVPRKGLPITNDHLDTLFRGPIGKRAVIVLADIDQQ